MRINPTYSASGELREVLCVDKRKEAESCEDEGPHFDEIESD